MFACECVYESGLGRRWEKCRRLEETGGGFELWKGAAMRRSSAGGEDGCRGTRQGWRGEEGSGLG